MKYLLLILLITLLYFSFKPSFKIDVVYTWVDGNDPVWKAKKNKLKDDIASKEFQLNERDESKEIALDTSKKNYIDPRIIKAWAEHVNLGGCNDDEDEEEEDEDEDEEKIAKHCVDKIYTKALLKHFRWAIEDSTFNEEWDYEDTELDCIVGEDLDPENGEVIVKKDEDLKKKCIKKVAKDFGVTEELVKKLIK